jgi:hypothetical protein
MSAPPSKTPNPPPAAILAAIDGPVSRRADEWRGGSPVLRRESRPDEVGRLACVGVRQRAKDKLGRRFGVLGDWIANLHARMYKTVARLEGKGGKFPHASELRGRSLTPVSGPRPARASFSPRSLAKTVQARYTARNEP